jgi:hypothetical protein
MGRREARTTDLAARDGSRWWRREVVGKETGISSQLPDLYGREQARQVSRGALIPAGDLRHGQRVGWSRG